MHILFCLSGQISLSMHSSMWITFPTLSCLVLCSFSVCLLHPFLKRLTVKSFSSVPLLFYCVILIFLLTEWVFMALFYAIIRRHLISLLMLTFLSHVQIVSRTISSVCLLKYPFISFSSHFCLLMFCCFSVWYHFPNALWIIFPFSF